MKQPDDLNFIGEYAAGTSPAASRRTVREHLDTYRSHQANVTVIPARHELFAWFSCTQSKSHINFLSCLGQGSDYFYVLNAGAFAYMEQQKLPRSLLTGLELEFAGEVICILPIADPADKVVRIETALDWQKWLHQQGIKTKQHRRIITEGALMGGLLAQGIPSTLSIVSADAG